MFNSSKSDPQAGASCHSFAARNRLRSGSTGSLLRIILVSFLTVLAAGGCRSRGAGKREVWAEVNGHPIYRDDVEAYYRRRLPSAQEAISGEQTLSLKLNILNELIDNELALERARKEQIVVSEAEIDHQVETLSSPYSPEEFQKKLADDGLTAATLRDQIRQHLLVEKLLDRNVRSRLKIEPAEVEAYYRNHQTQFNIPETRYHLAEILVTTARDPAVHNLRQSDAVGRAAAERKVKMIERELHAGQDFGRLAEQYSEDPATAAGGGDMGFVPASSVASDTRLRLAVNAMQVGELSGVVRDDKGNYHILKLLGREDGGLRPLSDPSVQKSIREALLSEREQVLKAAYLEDLRSTAKLKDELADHIVAAAGNPASVN
ncbi:MAG TPA: SurA N-terminal domain-containing protein [Terriglobia bacterium]